MTALAPESPDGPVSPPPQAPRTGPHHRSILGFLQARGREGVIAMIPKVLAFLGNPTPVGKCGFWGSRGACI